MIYELTDHFVVKSNAEDTWAFFSRAENLPAITPPWLRFTIATPGPIEIKNEALLDYTIRWMGVPIGWRTRIIEWSPPRQFVDLQVKGPYAMWHHQHTFTPVDDGTACTDRVLYRVPGGILGDVMNALTVKKQLFEIFRFRRKVIAERLGWVRAGQDDVVIRSL